ncbi:dihydroxyacetone kinase phosphoryl donor subunit DhaM [Curtobacterium citreum]|uniref:Phosphocarrier protein HPr n=1 Tax=Curtobacterium citreum TaxID=2036 RepID=A0ABT2HD73_9MICO|nr:dihydroxyacetone kinase phosphoryl donor subunit DhaM [Curtobacterium citreum]MCS6521215.1 dihydroxyacetone kinase phosphoryl donor subunit DhaM [Curtobacterium citreum]TQJ28070.1 phosphocarrier protein HPr /dihydroxyacetone kinase DhaM subunit [Curtobacterium citreum]
MTVGILVVSHSAAIATGTVELARQMAADVPMFAAGGTEDGGIGTSFEAITAGFEELGAADAVVVLCDLGSAYLTTDTALDFLDDDARARVFVSQAPLVEGTVAAAVAAQTGGDVDAVLAAAATAAASEAEASSASRADGDQPGGAGPGVGAASVDDVAASSTVELVNESGLHARPAAEFVKTATKHEATVRVNGVDAKSLLAIMALALPKGATVTIEATGADAQDAVDALTALVRSGFSE